MDVPPATPAMVACPGCGTRFPWPPEGPCQACGVDLTSRTATEVFDLDRRWAALAAERERLLAELRAARESQPPATPLGSPSGPAPRQPDPPTPPHGSIQSLGVPTLLGLAGAVLLTAAAAVFTAVAWTALPVLAKAAVLGAATAGSALAATTLHRRGIETAGAAMGAVTVAFAVVDIAGLDRGGLVALNEYVVPVAAAAGATAGWLLGRRGLRWVSTIGAGAAVVAAWALVVAVGETATEDVAVLTLLATAAAAAVGVTVPWWETTPARLTAGIGAAALTAAAGVAALGAVAGGEEPVVVGRGAALAPTAALAAASTRNRWALSPAVVLASAMPVAAAAGLGTDRFELAAVAAATLVAGAAIDRWWQPLPERLREPALYGLGPLAAGVTAASAGATGLTLGRAGRLLVADEPGGPIAPWAAVTLALAATGLTLWVPRRTVWSWAGAGAAVVLAAALPVPGAWIVGGVAAVLLAGLGRTGRAEPAAALAVAAALLPYGAAGAGHLLGAAGLLTVVGAALADRRGPAGDVAIAAAAAGGGLAAAAAATLAGAAGDVALGIGIAAAMLGTAPVIGRRGADDAWPSLAVAATATVVVLPAASGPRAAGILLLLAATGWLATAVLGWASAAWVASAVSSLGVGLLLNAADVEVVEAYAAVPAATLGATGLWWLAVDGTRSTRAALSPALSVALLPSLALLSGDPGHALRAIALAVAAALLATVGLRLRWGAPLVAGALAGGWVGLTQLAVVVDVVPRWVTFGLVGLLLVWLAATYERQQARARAVGRVLRDFR